MNIYIGNLERGATETELRELFEPFGQVASVSILKDRHSGQPKGFGFVEMPNKDEAQAAIENLKGKMLRERTMDIAEAQPRPKGGGGSRSFGNRRGGFGGGRRH
jgi:RNA recognition motif-containing protein